MLLSAYANNLETDTSRTQQAMGVNLYRPSLRKLKKVSGRLLRRLQGESEEKPPDITTHLLVVDDEESICFSLSDFFSQKGFTVDTAHEVEEAERLIEKTAYEVIIQDLRLGNAPRHNGLEVIRYVHQRNPETRVVVLTAYGTPEVENEALRSGADAFLRKPKALSQVAQVVQGLMESPKQRAARRN